ncbi:Hsp20/alpha crystallin family protein [Metabacillus sp. KIGAM252]|uniref:Hsp20/alpha crystallin family protein n=1 Tax=Metabacillus flavus TaxID=2823519 RepID=A0ABS5LEE4_9BACI|nr:Hsp20/alpha crystallin family protein [Metabacillus flavus]MBS2969107.1 Hsp20/alpha crystallin family protein [Metabacillus flavus]
MNDPKRSGASGFEGLDQWFAQFLDDPFSNGFADSFRTDIYETSDQYIIEADLTGILLDLITITKGNSCLTIRTLLPEKEAVVFLPFCLNKREMSALYTNGILEIMIQKEEQLNSPFPNSKLTIKPKQR